MPDIHVVRRGAALFPAHEEDREAIVRIPNGQAMRFQFRPARNIGLFRKWFSLAKLAFDLWAEQTPEIQYAGQAIKPSFDKFRKDLIVLAGYYTTTYGMDGSIELEPRSIAWHSMDDVEFERLYSATVDVVLRMVKALENVERFELERMVNQVMDFA